MDATNQEQFILFDRDCAPPGTRHTCHLLASVRIESGNNALWVSVTPSITTSGRSFGKVLIAHKWSTDIPCIDREAWPAYVLEFTGAEANLLVDGFARNADVSVIDWAMVRSLS